LCLPDGVRSKDLKSNEKTFVVPLLNQKLSAGEGQELPQKDEAAALIPIPIHLAKYGKNPVALTVEGDICIRHSTEETWLSVIRAVGLGKVFMLYAWAATVLLKSLPKRRANLLSFQITRSTRPGKSLKKVRIMEL
jgi:hypothetical protein